MSYLARLKQLEQGKNYHFVRGVKPSKPAKDPFDPFAGSSPPLIEKKIVDPKGKETAPDALTCHGLTLTELKTAAGDDWPEIEHDPVMLTAFAHALVAQAMRERCEIPRHYTQAVTCAGCGPVWLWPDARDTVLACTWCFVRVKGITPPRAELTGLSGRPST